MTIPSDYLDRPVAVVGAGTLGRRIALMFATRGGLVRIHDLDAKQGAAAVDFVDRQFDEARQSHPEWMRGRAEYAADLADAVDGAWLVVESIPERLDLKQALFARLEAAAPPDAILASNSSSYASRLIVAGLSTTQRMLNTHFTHPPIGITVEVMSCGETSPRVLDFLMTILPDYGLRPFLVHRESTGFIFNRIWAAIKRESLAVVAEGVSTPADVDEIFRLELGVDMGPFRAMDEVGLDVVYDIEQHYAEENPHLPTEPRKLLRRYIDSGKLGVKSGAGFYSDYPPPETVVEGRDSK
ncbi:3-hydroxyacyl-CoA dehydrogenase family protein [Nocardia sp. CDC159]|uniref:3-hydroxyacyl-CoA dehydrogenase family protein n=1 Tax=Nocardia pulmonis TaxID=2951408 RepID=A0A9X2J1R2_9NOCA|nr:MULTISPECIES: 3-hydroxyacyl-CoA dehydrogenase family protein [Nocardia]MCM6778390.1 3-hydroxyacyl-CoA dehydrogenase family protein [Nocardia pulmonis]MCM6791214.1 3-hydroxyacyl-CoA dehydrogenase family protein [Nocardia sp. CDC159]